MEKMWKCPKCGREFEHCHQGHSCNRFPLSEHFKNKPAAKRLFGILKKKLKQVGPFKIESLPCCIHFFSTFTFAAVFSMKDRIRISFSLPARERCLGRGLRISKNRYLYEVDIRGEKEIDRKIIGWLKRAYHLKDKIRRTLEVKA